MDDELEALWTAVTENRDDLAPRLVLADAWLERGNSRGEIIHLQCDGHPTLRATESDEPSSVYMAANDRQVALGERGHDLVASSWHEWFPELSTIIRLQGSWFHEGLLYGVRVQGTREDWIRLGDTHRRELAAVRKVRGVVGSDRFAPDPDTYIHALTRLPHHPDAIDIDSAGHADALYLAGVEWTTNEIRLGPEVDPRRVVELFPNIERLEYKPAHSYQRLTDDERRAILERVHEARATFPKLRTIGFASSWLQIRMTEADGDLARALRGLGVTGF